jgi:hypothetical protein
MPWSYPPRRDLKTVGEGESPPHENVAHLASGHVERIEVRDVTRRKALEGESRPARIGVSRLVRLIMR